MGPGTPAHASTTFLRETLRDMNGTAVSVIIPVYNDAANLEKALLSLEGQRVRPLEVIVVDDCSTDDSPRVAARHATCVLRNRLNSGPAVTRNRGIRRASGDVIAFMDADCTADEHWIENLLAAFAETDADAVMGRTRIPSSTVLGDCIAELGFPGGANAGFENIWKVTEDGYTDHITSCNFAARRETFSRYGVFDESFPLAGGEDPELSLRWHRQGASILFRPSVLVWHVPRTDLKGFFRWMLVRGRANYFFKQKVGNVGTFIKLRLWSSKNILRNNVRSPKILMVLPLLFLSLAIQQAGYIIQKNQAFQRRAG